MVGYKIEIEITIGTRTRSTRYANCGSSKVVYVLVTSFSGCETENGWEYESTCKAASTTTIQAEAGYFTGKARAMEIRDIQQRGRGGKEALEGIKENGIERK